MQSELEKVDGIQWIRGTHLPEFSEGSYIHVRAHAALLAMFIHTMLRGVIYTERAITFTHTRTHIHTYTHTHAHAAQSRAHHAATDWRPARGAAFLRQLRLGCVFRTVVASGSLKTRIP